MTNTVYYTTRTIPGNAQRGFKDRHYEIVVQHNGATYYLYVYRVYNKWYGKKRIQLLFEQSYNSHNIICEAKAIVEGLDNHPLVKFQ